MRIDVNLKKCSFDQKEIDEKLYITVFGLLSSSLLLFLQRFGRYVLRPSGVCRTREPTRNFELRPLLNPQGSPDLIPLVRQTPEGQRTYRPKRCGNNNKDEDNSPKTLNNKNHQASSQKFRQLKCIYIETVVINYFHESETPNRIVLSTKQG